MDALKGAGLTRNDVGAKLAALAGEPGKEKSYTQRLRQALMNPELSVAAGSRPPPEGWPLAASECAEERAAELLRIADQIRAAHNIGPRGEHGTPPRKRG